MFDNIAGLKAGAPVRVAGVEVGAVSRRRFVGDRVEVDAGDRRRSISRASRPSRARPWARCRCWARRRRHHAVEPGHADSRMGLHSDRQAARRPIPEVGAQATESLEEATALLRDIRAGGARWASSFTDDARVPRIERVRRRPPSASPRRLRRDAGTLGRLTNDRALYRRAAAAVQRSQRHHRAHPQRRGQPRQAPERPGIGQLADGDDAEHRSVTGKLNRGEGTAGQAAQRNGALRSA